MIHLISKKVYRILFTRFSFHYDISFNSQINIMQNNLAQVIITFYILIIFQESELCDKFYVCKLNKDEKIYQLEERVCRAGTMFSYETYRCVKTG